MRTGRKLVGALASLFAAALLYEIGTLAASGMPLQCTANSNVTPLVRAEGITEKVGDVVLSCTGGAPIDPGVFAPKADIYISLNASVTSRILNPDNSATEALLIIDEPPEADQKVCVVGTTCNVAGVGSYAIGPYLPPGAYNVWQGTLADGC
jgi:hypothetical protein